MIEVAIEQTTIINCGKIDWNHQKWIKYNSISYSKNIHFKLNRLLAFVYRTCSYDRKNCQKMNQIQFKKMFPGQKDQCQSESSLVVNTKHRTSENSQPPKMISKSQKWTYTMYFIAQNESTTMQWNIIKGWYYIAPFISTFFSFMRQQKGIKLLFEFNGIRKWTAINLIRYIIP